MKGTKVISLRRARLRFARRSAKPHPVAGHAASVIPFPFQVGPQFLAEHPRRRFDRSAMLRRNRRAAAPLRDTALGDADGLGQGFLCSENGDGAPDAMSVHGAENSGAISELQERRSWNVTPWRNSVAHMDTDSRRSKPTPADVEAARRLNALWRKAAQKRRGTSAPLTQERMVEAFQKATGKGSQGLISQYLLGRIPLNYRAVMVFAQEIGCKPEEIRDDLPEFRAATAVEAVSDDGWTDVGMEPRKWKFPIDILRAKRLRADELDVMHSPDESMEPRIHAGDDVVFDSSDTTPRDGKLYAVSYGGQQQVKRLIMIGNAWCLSSDNTDAKWRRPIPVDGLKDFHILGRVRWVAGWED